MAGDAPAPSSPAFACSIRHDVVVSVWSRGGDESDVRVLLDHVDDAADANEGRAGVLMVITEHTSLPTSSARKLAGSYVRTRPGRIAHMAIVVEGSGFWASAMRSVFSGIGLLYRPKAPWTMVATVDDAVRWLVQHGAVDEPNTGELNAAVDELRSAVQGACVEGAEGQPGKKT